jgi:predicted nuclease of predicted toxin-antitoxin system
MRFLIDNALSPVVALRLATAGHDAIHVRDRGLHAAPDLDVLHLASLEDRIIVSADTDFGTILALRHLAKPSFILLRGDVDRRPDRQADMLLQCLPGLENSLEGGAVVVISGTRIRIRTLPVRFL